jgi:serine protease
MADRTGSSGAAYRPGRVIVKFRDGASTAARVTAMRDVSRTASLSTRPDNADFDVISIDAGDDAEAVARAFSERPDVEYAQAAYRMHAMFKPNDRFYARQWNLPLIDMERAWDIQPAAGSSITVAVIDTGVAYTSATMRFRAASFRDDRGVFYPALGDLTLSFVAATELGPSTRFVAPHDFIWDDSMPVDLDGHGTHVSGTIGQLTNNAANGGDAANGGGTAGVAFNVKLMPVKVIDGDWDFIFGSPNQGTDDVVARGIRYAADNGAKVLNMSIGRTGPAAPVIEDAIKYAVSKGAFVVIAGGNEFEQGNPTEVLAEIASRVQGAVSVAAVDQARAHAYYSSVGTWVEIAGPGGSFRGFNETGGILQQTLDLDLVETFNEPPARYTAPRFDALAYFYFTGTSQAAPHVAGVAAMLMQQGITDPVAVESALERFATDLGSAGRDSTFGFGLVNARSTLRGLGLAK